MEISFWNYHNCILYFYLCIGWLCVYFIRLCRYTLQRYG
nr:MAG TPA: hypothetical protein [Caudoviricetes sp.]DAT68308.1 MAG TPA: hypothetical protein [Caudoviricetes sp.]